MSLLQSLIFVVCASAQSLVSSASVDPRTNTCLRRTVIGIYTQDSSTYVVTNLGTTSFPGGPTICPNVSTVTRPGSTVTRPGSTVTVTQQPAASGPTVITDAGFEDGQESPFNTSASSPQVSAEVVKGGSGVPLQPFDGNNFLLITFNNSSPAPPRVKRQAAAEPQVYNVTQNFAATAGISYKLQAYAAQAPNGDGAPGCSIKICGDDSCGGSTALTASYAPYSYQYNASVSESSAVATFSISCPQSAYVALDNVTVSSGNADIASTETTTVVQYVTRTQTQPAVTETQSGAILTETTQQIGTPGTQTNTLVSVVTETAVTSVPHTKTNYQNFTVSQLSTTTTTITQTLNSTTTIDHPPTVVIETATATATSLITYTDYSLSVSLLSATPETLTTSERMTLEITTTIPPPAASTYISTELSTSIVFSTVVQTTLVSVTLDQATESIPYTQRESYFLTESITLPQATFTPPPETIYNTVTLPAVTITSIISVTPPPSTVYQTFTEIPATQTLQLTRTLPANTSIELRTLTRTLPVETQTSVQNRTFTLPRETQTTIEVQTYTLPGETVITTLILGETTTTTTSTSSDTTSSESSSTGSSSTETTSSETSSSEEPSTVPTPTDPGVPPVALARPTAIVGDVYDGADQDYDDYTFPLTLPFALTLYGQSNNQVTVTTNSILGLGNAGYEYYNQPLPNYSGYEPQYGYGGSTTGFLDTGVLPMWDDLYIYQGSQQGIYYQIDGSAPSRQVTFEFYLSHISDRNQFYHFLILMWENRPNIVTFKYLNVTDHGGSATVGVESYSANAYLQYSFNSPAINSGMQLTFDTSSGNGVYNVDAAGTP